MGVRFLKWSFQLVEIVIVYSEAEQRYLTRGALARSVRGGVEMIEMRGRGKGTRSSLDYKAE